MFFIKCGIYTIVQRLPLHIKNNSNFFCSICIANSKHYLKNHHLKNYIIPSIVPVINYPLSPSNFNQQSKIHDGIKDEESNKLYQTQNDYKLKSSVLNNHYDEIDNVSFRAINVLEPPECPEDVEFIAPLLKPTFNLAAYADKSEMLKHFINLGVNIGKWEKDKKFNDVCSVLLRMDFEKEVKPFIFFLHDIGISAEDMGLWLTKNPQIFLEEIENLYIRVNYLKSKQFTKESIASIIGRVPKWINLSTIKIDKELGIYQRRFKLTGNEMRALVVADPKLIVFTLENPIHLERLYFSLEEELGFSKSQMKKILLRAPRIYRTSGNSLFRRFDVVHHEMGLTHQIMTQYPKILLCRDRILSERHEFLKFLGKNQYNPEQSNYISPTALVESNDGDFSVNVVGSSLDLYNDFLKTL